MFQDDVDVHSMDDIHDFCCKHRIAFVVCVRDADKTDKDGSMSAHALVTLRDKDKFIDKAKLALSDVADYLLKMMNSAENGDTAGQPVRTVTSETKSSAGDALQNQLQVKSNFNITFFQQVKKNSCVCGRECTYA